MSVDIHDLFMAEVRKEMDSKGLFTPEDGWKGYEWESKNYIAAEKALGDVCEEFEVYELFSDFVKTHAERISNLTERRIELNKSNSFDPSI